MEREREREREKGYKNIKCRTCGEEEEKIKHKTCMGMQKSKRGVRMDKKGKRK